MLYQRKLKKWYKATLKVTRSEAEVRNSYFLYSSRFLYLLEHAGNFKPVLFAIVFPTALDTSQPQPIYSQVKVPQQGNSDGMQREIDKVAVNEGLIRTALIVLQNSMANLSMVTNKLNLDIITQKHKLDRLTTRVSHEYKMFLPFSSYYFYILIYFHWA